MSIRDRVRQEKGFTLIELMIAVVVSSIVVAGITSAFIAAMGSTNQVHDRFIESHDAQRLSTHFTSDVQSADPSTIDTASGTSVGCAPPHAGGMNVVRLQWKETISGVTTHFSAAYRVTSPSDGALTRYFCFGPDLSTATATPTIVARNLSISTPALAVASGSGVKLNLTAKSGYTYSLSATARMPGLKFIVNPLTATPEAGTSFNVELRASTDGTTTDTSYHDPANPKSLAFSGPAASPGGTAPLYPAQATFINGVATVPVTLFKTGATTLVVTEGNRRGSASVTVRSATVQLAFSPCPPATATNTSTAMKVVRGTDVYGNADSAVGTAITVSLSATGGTFAPPGPLTIPAGSTETSATAYKTPLTSGSGVTLTAASSASGYSAGTCNFTTTGVSIIPIFSVSSTGSQVAGTAFNVTVTASDGMTTDASYNGTQTLTFSGPANSPNGTAPVYPATVNFTNGVGTASVKLHAAGTSTLTVNDGTRTGSTSVVVSAAPVQLAFSACPPNTKKGTATVEQVTRAATDSYGNADPNTASAVTVTLSANTGSFSVTSVSIPANATSSGNSTFTNPNGNNHSVTLTATPSSSGYAPATCSFITIN